MVAYIKIKSKRIETRESLGFFFFQFSKTVKLLQREKKLSNDLS